MKGTLALPAAVAVLLGLTGPAAAAGPAEAANRASPPPESWVHGWARHLESPDAAMRVRAANALAKFGPRGAPAAPALLRMVGRPPKRVPGRNDSPSVAAARALWAIRPQAVTDVLVGDDRQASLNVIEALAGVRDPGAAKALQLAMIDHNDEVRLAATKAMGGLAAAKGVVLPPTALRRLAKATEDARPDVRAAAVDALDRLPASQGEKPLIEALRFGSYRDARMGAMRALSGRSDAASQKALRAALGDKDHHLAAAAKQAGDHGQSVGGLITAETLANTKGLRPLSTIAVHAPKRSPARHRSPFEGRGHGNGPAVNDATARLALAQLQEMGAPTDLVSGLQNGDLGAVDRAMGPGTLDRLLSDPATLEMAKQLYGGQAAPGGVGFAEALEFARKNKGLPPAPSRPKSTECPKAGGADWQHLLRAAQNLATMPQPGGKRKGK